MIGHAVAHYRLLEKLGEGGMGVVYKAEDQRLGRHVAVKLLSSRLISDHSARRRFVREAKATAALDHPGICTVYEAGEADGQLFIAMALLEGETLRKRVASGPLPAAESLDIAIQAGAALAAAHAKGIVHRDIKPENIMLLPGGRAKVMDFGLARIADSSQITNTGTALGTVAYMSPEQLRGEAVDARTDIWSLGVVLYEMLAGKLPFRAAYEPALKYEIVHNEPTPLGDVGDDVSAELERVVYRCLKKQASDRYARVEDVVAELQRVLGEKSVEPRHSPARGSDRTPAPVPTSSISAVQILGDRYRIERPLGRGGMGEVWLAFDLKLGVEVALKFLLPDLVSDPARVVLLRREVRSARNVASPHVCRVFDLIEIEGQEVVSMEYVDGTTLQDVLVSQSPLEIVEARRIATQLLSGLQDIHDAGLIHRDLKPANVMITRSGRAVVMDFGLAKGEADSRAMSVVGTPAYMSPEQMRGEVIDARADLYAVGMILAEMVAREGVRDPAVRRALWDGLRQDPAKAPAGPWEGTIRRAVATNRGERFSSAAEMSRSLGDASGRISIVDEESPYPGLSIFTGEQSRFFFGRELDVESMWRKVSRLSLSALIGPSGVGKSSFLRAGVMASRPEGWNIAITSPGNNPFNSLGQSLLSEFAGQSDAQDLFRLNEIDRSIPLLNKWRQRSKQALLIVDQFEELFTLNPPEIQERFAEMLGRLSVEADIHVLVSMRDDFFFLCHQYPALTPLFSAAMPLGPLSAQDLRRAIVEPARLCGFAFEDDALVDEMMKEVEGERGALPLVAFAAAKLWDLRDRVHGVISRRSYEEIGRVGGALAQHAEATLERIGHERDDIVREIFRNLVTAHNTRVVRERDELLSVFADRAAAGEVLNALIDARLLTSFEIPEAREGSSERHRIEIVHESLLTSWPRLVRWQTQDTEGAQLRDQLRQAAQLWKERNESDDLLWTGTAYKEFELWRERYPGGLTDVEGAFAQGMTLRARRQRRRRRMAVASSFVVLLAVIAVIGWSARQEKLARLHAEASHLVALGKPELDGDKPTEALAYAIASLELADTPANRHFALEALPRGPAASVFPLRDQFGAGPMSFSPDGSHLAVGGWSGALVLSRDGSAPVVMDSAAIYSFRNLVFLPDGDRVVFRVDSEQWVWSLSQGKVIRKVDLKGIAYPAEEGIAQIAQPGVDGDQITFIMVSPGLAAFRWSGDENEPVLLARWNMKEEGLTGIWTGTGGWLFIFRDRQVYVDRFSNLFPGGPDARPVFGRAQLVGEHASRVKRATSDSTGTWLATADQSGEIRVWSRSRDSFRQVRIFRVPPPVLQITFDPSHTHLAALCGPEQLARLWDLQGPCDAEPRILRHKGNRFGSQLAFDPTGQWIFVGYMDEMAVWPVHRPGSYTMQGRIAPGLRAFTPDGQSLLGASPSWKILRIWNLHGEPTRDLFTAPSGSTHGNLDPSGRFAAVSLESGLQSTTYVVSIANGSARKLIEGDGPWEWSPDGRSLAGGTEVPGGRCEYRLWDVETGAFRVLQQEDGAVTNAARVRFSNDGSLFMSGAGGVIKQSNAADGTAAIVARGSLPQVWDFSVSGDGGRLLAAFNPKGFPKPDTRSELKLFDLRQNTERTITTFGNNVMACVLDSTGETMAVLDYSGAIRVGPVDGGEPHVLIGPQGLAIFAVSRDWRWLAVGTVPENTSSDTTFTVWRMPEGRPIQTLPHDAFLDHLRAQTNLRVVSDASSLSGYRVDKAPFPGWGNIPSGGRP